MLLIIFGHILYRNGMEHHKIDRNVLNKSQTTQFLADKNTCVKELPIESFH